MNLQDRIMAGLLGQPQSYGGLLSQQDQNAARQRAMQAMAAQLLAAGGPSDRPTSLGQALGSGIMAGQQAQGQSEQDMLQAMLLRTQLQQKQNKPSAIEEYEYAKGQGYKGSFEDYKRIASAQPQAPAGIQEYEYFQKLTPEQQKQFMSLQRSPVVPKVVTLGGVPTLVDPTSTTAPSPLSTQDAELDAARKRKEAEARGSAEGEAFGALAKKGINALNVMESLKLAEPLVDVATGSGVGAATDKVAAFFGKSLEGDQAIAQLKIIQANLMTNMPRMEGPQSDRDVQLYREAVGELGDPTVPGPRKKAAISMIMSLQQKYADMSGVTPKPADSPKRSREEILKEYGL